MLNLGVAGKTIRNAKRVGGKQLGCLHQGPVFSVWVRYTISGIPQLLKRAQGESFLFQCCRGSGQSMILCPPQDCKSASPPPSMPSFEPRPFPPSSLTGVPIEYITQQLHNLAPQFWDKPETADCTISMSSNTPSQFYFSPGFFSSRSISPCPRKARAPCIGIDLAHRTHFHLCRKL
jgi:hypothetical protein